MDFDKHADLMQKVEEIHEDLKPYVFQHTKFSGLNHPLVQEIPLFDITRCAMINARYAQKREAVAKALADGNWSQLVMLHERPYRFEALQGILDKVSQDELPGLISWVWTDSENIWQHQKAWKEMWVSLDNPHAAMDELETLAYGSMPAEITIFRGITARSRNRDGLSWTTNLEKARWFANRFAPPNPTIICGEVDKAKIFAYFARRNESEIVVDPRHIRNKRIGISA